MPPLAIIGAVAGIVGAVVKAKSGSKAAKKIVKANELAVQTQKDALERQIDLTEPFRQSGLGALDLLNDIFVGGQTEKIQELPGISFLREQGEKSIGRFQAARGNFLSGAALKEGIRFNQGLASTNLAQATDPLGFLAAQGQAAAVGQASNIGIAGRSIGSLQVASGQTRANNAINIGSSINEGINNVLFSLLSGRGGFGGFGG